MRSQSSRLTRFVLMSIIGLGMALFMQPKPGPGCKGASVGAARAAQAR